MREDRKTRSLRGRIERPQQVTFWGQKYTITPRLIARVFGDGKNLLCVTPLATRPNYFVVRVDSSVTTPQDPFPASDQVSLIERIMEAAEEEYGYFGDERDENGDESRDFPVVDWGIGCTWGKPFPQEEW